MIPHYAVVLKLLEGNLRILFFSPSNNRPFNFNFSVPSFYFPHLFIFQIDVNIGDRKTSCQNICSKKTAFASQMNCFHTFMRPIISNTPRPTKFTLQFSPSSAEISRLSDAILHNDKYCKII